jgi:hypothetical protein
MTQPYHPGEIAVQELAGERGQAILNGRVLSPVIPSAARRFVGEQSCAAVAWLDAEGAPWASLAIGTPGFASCNDDGTTVTLEALADALPLGPTAGDLRLSTALGLLFIDLGTRRRLRVNGVVTRATPEALLLSVEQAFANCPKYIQRREPVEAPAGTPTAIATGLGVPPDIATWLAGTDTAFVATLGPAGRLDCSHRGGRPGFITLAGDAVVVPDYPGNSMFCSLGNMAVAPRAGLVLVDFERHQQLHLTGEVTVTIGPAGSSTDLAWSRHWTLRPHRWAISGLPGSRRWLLSEASPFNPRCEP